MNKTAIIDEAVADYFEAHEGWLEKMGANIHAYHDLDAMANETTNGMLRSVFDKASVDIKTRVEDMADITACDVLYILKCDGGRWYDWKDVYKAVMDAATECAAEME